MFVFFIIGLANKGIDPNIIPIKKFITTNGACSNDILIILAPPTKPIIVPNAKNNKNY